MIDKIVQGQECHQSNWKCSHDEAKGSQFRITDPEEDSSEEIEGIHERNNSSDFGLFQDSEESDLSYDVHQELFHGICEDSERFFDDFLISRQRIACFTRDPLCNDQLDVEEQPEKSQRPVSSREFQFRREG